MEQAHQPHKETQGWLAVLRDWRASRARTKIRDRRVVTPWSLRAFDDWTA